MSLFCSAQLTGWPYVLFGEHIGGLGTLYNMSGDWRGRVVFPLITLTQQRLNHVAFLHLVRNRV